MSSDTYKANRAAGEKKFGTKKRFPAALALEKYFTSAISRQHSTILTDKLRNLDGLRGRPSPIEPRRRSDIIGKRQCSHDAFHKSQTGSKF